MPRERDSVDEMLDQWARERPDLDSSAMAVVLRIVLLSGVLGDRLKETLAPAGLAPWEFDVLSALRRAGPSRGLSSKELCESAQLTSGAMTHRIDRLVKRGLVRRKVDPRDRRSIAVLLRPKGRALVDEIIGARMADAALAVQGLKKRERQMLARLLRDVALDLTGSVDSVDDAGRGND